MTSAHHAPSFDAAGLCPGLYEVSLPEGVPPGTRVWRLDLAQASGWREQAQALLDAGERQRNARFIHQADADRHALSHAALRCLLGAWLETPAAGLRLSIGASGKPFLPEAAAPHFNLSHAGGHALIGLSSNHAIGIDLEVIDPDRPIGSLASMLMSSEELACCGTPCSPEAFYRIWTAREAVFKAWGSGLRDDLASWTMLPLQGDAELGVSGPGPMPGPTRLWQLSVPAGHAAALALLALPG